MKKIYVLTTGSTASASELLINALKGVDVEVVQIGTTTEGKNVGSTVFDSSDYENSYKFGNYHYVLRPITYKSNNAKGECNYANGFTPTVGNTIDELDYLTLYDFGDSQEVLLNKALQLIGVTQQVPTKTLDRQIQTRLTGLHVMPKPESQKKSKELIF